MPVAYPSHLRTILKAGKSRTQPAAFSMAQPRRGYAYTQATGTDVPVFWDVSFFFSQADAQVFWLWVQQSLNRGQDEFTLPIRTEFGMVEHLCRFLPDSLLPVQEQGGLFGYSATIMARALVIPPGYEAAAGLIVGLPAWQSWALTLDEVVTAELPEA